jgi:hypothetical protein
MDLQGSGEGDDRRRGRIATRLTSLPDRSRYQSFFGPFISLPLSGILERHLAPAKALIIDKSLSSIGVDVTGNVG